jgi:hypothetical protein
MSKSAFLKSCIKKLEEYDDQRKKNIKFVRKGIYQDAGEFLRCLVFQMNKELSEAGELQNANIIPTTFYSSVLKHLFHHCNLDKEDKDHERLVSYIDTVENDDRTGEEEALIIRLYININDKKQENKTLALEDIMLRDADTIAKCPANSNDHNSTVTMRSLLWKYPQVLV